MYDYEEEEHFFLNISKNRRTVLIHDISMSGLAIILRKGEEGLEAGSLVYIELPSLFSKEEKARIDEFRIHIFGIIRYKRRFDSEDTQILGIKFAKTINDPELLNLFEKIGTPLK